MAAIHPRRATFSCLRRQAIDRRRSLAAAALLATGAIVSGGGVFLRRTPPPEPASATTAASTGVTSVRSEPVYTPPPQHPSTLEAGRWLLTEQPQRADKDGSACLAELLRRAEFANALELAESAPPALRREWLITVFSAWARHDPVAARELGTLLIQHGAPREAWQPVLRGWSETAASQLAEYAVTLPRGEARTSALELALDRWIQNEPGAAAAWIERLGPSAERDQALAALVTRTDTAVRPRATALAWVREIADPHLRTQAAACVLREWAQTDPAQARVYAEHAGGFTPAQRRQLCTALDPPPPHDF